MNSNTASPCSWMMPDRLVCRRSWQRAAVDIRDHLNKEDLVVEAFDNNTPGKAEAVYVIKTCLTVHGTVQFHKKLVVEAFYPGKVKQCMIFQRFSP